MNKPNLYRYATSERDQDAFLCWLIDWACEDCYEASGPLGPLYYTAKIFLSYLLGLHEIDSPAEYSIVDVRRQYKGLDILVLLNDDLAVLIEDKLDTSEHSGQLQRYLEIVERDFWERKLCPIYLKTGGVDRRSLGLKAAEIEAVENAGWKCFDRQDLCHMLQLGKKLGVRNDIYDDFCTSRNMGVVFEQRCLLGDTTNAR